jgi:hypothetical protein
VIWDFAGEPIPEDLRAAMEQFSQQLASESEFVKQLREHLNEGEIQALAKRTERLLKSGRFPDPHPSRRPYPWPPV